MTRRQGCAVVESVPKSTDLRHREACWDRWPYPPLTRASRCQSGQRDWQGPPCREGSLCMARQGRRRSYESVIWSAPAVSRYDARSGCSGWVIDVRFPEPAGLGSFSSVADSLSQRQQTLPSQLMLRSSSQPEMSLPGDQYRSGRRRRSGLVTGQVGPGQSQGAAFDSEAVAPARSPSGLWPFVHYLARNPALHGSTRRGG